jgi:hypothetical protein
MSSAYEWTLRSIALNDQEDILSTVLGIVEPSKDLDQYSLGARVAKNQKIA